MSENNGAITSELLIDTKSVCVDLERYDELVKCEENLRIIRGMYHSGMSSYNYDDAFSAMFGKKGEQKDAE